jgi:hypothetical protein
MKTIMRSLGAVIWLGGVPAAGAAPLEFDLAGVEVTLPDNGWEIRALKSAWQRIDIDTGGFTRRQIDRRLLVRRSDAGKVLAILMITGSLAELSTVRFRDRSCPKVPADLYYWRHLSLNEDDPPQCVFMGGPFDGSKAIRTMSEDAHGMLAELNTQPPDSAWQVLAFTTTTRGAQLSVAGVVSADGFDGLPGTQPLAKSPARVPRAVAAWADALAAALEKALDCFGTCKTTLPRMSFTAADAPR